MNSNIKLAVRRRGRLEGSLFNRYFTRWRAGCFPSSQLHHFILDTYLKMLSVKQRDIKYHFLESLVCLCLRIYK